MAALDPQPRSLDTQAEGAVDGGRGWRTAATALLNWKQSKCTMSSAIARAPQQFVQVTNGRSANRQRIVQRRPALWLPSGGAITAGGVCSAPVRVSAAPMTRTVHPANCGIFGSCKCRTADGAYSNQVTARLPQSLRSKIPVGSAWCAARTGHRSKMPPPPPPRPIACRWV